MIRRAFAFLPFVLIAVLGVSSAAADPPTVLYRLVGNDYAFQEGCFGECMCPVFADRLAGTFGLTPAGTSGGFETWTVSDVDWFASGQGIHLTGTGLYRRSVGQEPDTQQQLLLDLSIDDGPVEHYDSGVVPAEAAFPRIDALISLFDLQCWDRVLHVEAAPNAEHVAFRFEATVTSVFDGLGSLGDSVAPGDLLRGFYVFDPATPNTAPHFDEGEAGLYHHDRPPAGVKMRVGQLGFRSVRAHPDFDIIVNNEVGFAGADEYGFVSRNNRAHGLLTPSLIDRLDIDWLASTFTEDPLSSADLPLVPPDLNLLGGGLLTIYGECTLCAGPASLFRIEATLTSLTRPVHLSLDRQRISWEGPESVSEYDIVSGDLEALRTAGEFTAATEQCLAGGQPGTELAHPWTPAPGQAHWFVARPSGDAQTAGSYDSPELAQELSRDDGIDAAAGGCP